MADAAAAFNEESTQKLHEFALKGDADMITYLVRKGADVNGPNAQGETPLMLAAAAQRRDAVKALMENGADTERRDPAGATARMIAVSQGDNITVKIIDDGLARRARLKLFKAIREKDVALVRQILEDKEVPHLGRGDQGEITPLSVAISSDSPACVTLLLEAGASAEAVSSRGEKTPLCHAINAWKPNLCIIAKLLEHGARPDTPSDSETAPLTLAATYGHESVLYLLLDHGADPDQAFSQGHTAAHKAAQFGRPGIIRVLSERGANLDAVDDEGYSPLDVAVTSRHRNAAEALLRAGADPLHIAKGGATLVMEAAWSGEADIIPGLLQRGLNIDARRAEDGMSALMYAAYVGMADTARVLLGQGADLALKNNEGKFALEIANERGHAHIAALILDRMASQIKTGIEAPSPVRSPYRLQPRIPKNQ